VKPQREGDWFTIASALISPDPRQGAIALQMNPREDRNYRLISNLNATGRWHCHGRFADLSPAMARYTALCHQHHLQDYIYLDQHQRHVPRFLVPIEGSFLTAEVRHTAVRRSAATHSTRVAPRPRRAGLLNRLWSQLAPGHGRKNRA